MDKIIKISLSPTEPFFLGNDRTFHYGEEDKKRTGSRYFIRSEQWPFQTSAFGVLRYLGIRKKNTEYVLSETDKENIGESSFSYDMSNQKFGRIRHISPVFLENTTQRELYIQIPRDHLINHDTYVPFHNYSFVQTSDGGGKKLLPLDFDAKDGISEDFISVNCLHMVLRRRDIFHGIEKVGIDVQKLDAAFFKMEYVRMERGYAFTFFATVDESFTDITDRTVFLGAKKSLFLVSAEQVDNEPAVCLPAFPLGLGIEMRKMYFLSDTWIKEEYNEKGDEIKGIKTLLKLCAHSNMTYRTARGYKTYYSDGKNGVQQKGRFKKTDQLYRLIKAGGVIIYEKENEKEIINMIDNNNDMRIIGCNNYLIGGMK